MAWLSLGMETDCLHAEALADALLEHGALAVSIEDADAGTPNESPQFGEPGSPAAPLWQHSRIPALFETDADVAGILAAAAERAGLAAQHVVVGAAFSHENWSGAVALVGAEVFARVAHRL